MVTVAVVPWQEIEWSVFRGIQSRQEVVTLLGHEMQGNQPEWFLFETLRLIIVEANRSDIRDSEVAFLLDIVEVIGEILLAIRREHPNFADVINRGLRAVLHPEEFLEVECVLP